MTTRPIIELAGMSFDTLRELLTSLSLRSIHEKNEIIKWETREDNVSLEKNELKRMIEKHKATWNEFKKLEKWFDENNIPKMVKRG